MMSRWENRVVTVTAELLSLLRSISRTGMSYTTCRCNPLREFFHIRQATVESRKPH